MDRHAGILMHITSLPSPYGIGTIGKAAYEFTDFLENSGQKYWQILPIGPTGYGNSPYTSYSTYAGNPLLIDLDDLIYRGLLKKDDVENIDWGDKSDYVDYDKVEANKLKVLKKAYDKANEQNTVEFDEFCENEAGWLDDYALYMAIRETHFKGLPYSEWPDENIRLHKPEAVEEYNEKLFYEVKFFKFLQYCFFSQWNKFKAYVNSKDIKIIGDIPIYVPMDSSDVWANPKEFALNEDGDPQKVSGCPPDAFSPSGQLWGHPLYDWSYMKETDYEWWMNRIKGLSKLYDITRIDHFRAFDTYYSIPNDGEENAVSRGEWVQGPGYYFFEVLNEKLGDVEIIAEDLGKHSKSVGELLKQTGYPGMKVLILTFDSRDKNMPLPYAYKKNSVVYTGTHDNDTVMGWFNGANEQDKVNAQRYCVLTEEEGYNWGFIRTAYATACDTAIIPMQDILGLGSEHRMNVPSVVGGNWSYRLDPGIDLSEYSKKLKELCEIYRR